MNASLPTASTQLSPAARTRRTESALDVIDQLLRATGTVQGDDVDWLLDLRWLLHGGEDAESAVAVFCRLRRQMEERHYLAFYRLRRWLEEHLQATVRVRRGEAERNVQVRLDRYCVEAIRHEALRRASKPGEPLLAPRVRFIFVGRPAAEETHH